MIRRISIISVLLFISGFLYITSLGISEYFPPTINFPYKNIIFHDHSAYANYYLKSSNTLKITPSFISFYDVDKACRLCRIGRIAYNFENFEKVIILGRNDFDYDEFAKLNNLFLFERKLIGMSLLDRLQFNWLTPVFRWRYYLFTFKRANSTFGIESGE